MAFSRTALVQPQVASRLEADLASGLPQALLFAGPAYSGRMSAALETALTLTGEDDQWERLGTSRLVIISDRDSQLRLKAAEGILSRSRNQAAMDNLVHETRILLSSCHEALWTASDKDLFNAADELGSLFYELPDMEDGKAVDAFLKDYDAALGRFLSKKRKGAGFTIDQVRAVQAFLQQGAGQVKCVILEGIEDVTTGAMNSVLKLLEEPPEGAYIILVSKNRTRILPTVLSRVRPYDFHPIEEARQEELLMRRFAASGYNSIEDFIQASSGLDMAKLDAFAEEFVHSLLVRHEPQSAAEMTTLCTFLDSFSSYEVFLRRVMAIVEDGMRGGHVAPREARRCLSIVSSACDEALRFNQNKRTMLDRISRGLVKT